VFLDNVQQAQRRPDRAFRTGFPLLHGRSAGVQIARKNRLAHVITLADFLNLTGRNFRGHRQSALVKLTHRRLGDRSHAMQCARRRMNRLERIALKFTFRRHGKSPVNRRRCTSGPMALT